MKIIKFILILFVSVCLQTIGYCNSSNSQKLERIYWEGSSPNAVAAQANKMPSINPSASLYDDSQMPIMNPIGAYGSMLQMNNTNTYNAVEQQKQQMDYAKLQTKEQQD